MKRIKRNKPKSKRYIKTFKRNEIANPVHYHEEVRSLKKSGRMMIYIIGFLLLFVMVLIGFDFAHLAITGEKFGVNFLQRAYELYSVEEVERSKRGTIYDAQGNPLAEELKSYKIYANLNPNYGLSYVTDIELTARKLSEHLDLSYNDIYERLNKENVSQVEFGTAGGSLTYVQKSEIEALELPGINFIESSSRSYPNGVFASHSLGYAVFDPQENRLVGHMGLELHYDDILAGQNGTSLYMRDRKGYLIPDQEKITIGEKQDGQDIYTTIDFSIQNLLDEALTIAEEENEPEGLIAVVANAKTGEIVALGNRKTFDPNLRNVENYYNPVIQHPIEPGSTMKIFTYAAAINEGNYNGNTRYLTGSTKIGGMTIKDWKPSGWGSITLDQGFYISSNTGIMNLLSSVIDTKTFLDYLKAFGFGETTGIELPGESAGTFPRENDYTNQLTAGFGQGFLVTPIQLVRAMTAILNDGEMLQPYLVSKIYDPNTNEIVHEGERTVVGNPISAETAQKVKELMYGVNQDSQYGSGYIAYRMEDIPTGGKTGTAQIADTENGGYLANQYIYSFMGFAPYDDPEYIIYLAIDRPNSTAGHAALGKIFKTLVQNTVGSNMDVEETEAELPVYESVEVSDYKNQEVNQVAKEIEEAGLTPIIIGNGSIVYNQSPLAGSSLIKGDKVFIQTGEETKLPDFYGWTAADVTNYNSLAKLNLQIEGQGFVTEQSAKAGTTIKQDSTYVLNLKAKLTNDDSEESDEAEESNESESETNH